MEMQNAGRWKSPQIPIHRDSRLHRNPRITLVPRRQSGARSQGFKKERQVILMDWGSWSPSHTILVLFIVAGFIGQLAIYFYRTGQNDKKIDKQGETFVHALERLEDRMDKRFSEMIAMSDKRFVEVNQRFDETNQRIGETNQRIDGLRSEMNQRLSDMDASIQQMNQNHIEHLNRHHS